MADFMRSPTLL